MSLLQVRIIPDPVLRQQSKIVSEFNDELSSFIRDMWETMYASKGIGLAAPQVGILKRVVVIDLAEEDSNKFVLINPEIIEKKGKIQSEEGCLSIPDFRDSIQRTKIVKVRAQDTKGDYFELEADGLLSRCIQHEIDHLNGVLFVDHLSRLKRDFYKKWLADRPELNESTGA